ncbi:MAG: GNAT family N-acetyltransferase [Spirochaetales bacterium]|nr:GNAT family N-acetyltransferase [Spirochaetales bacterium]
MIDVREYEQLVLETGAYRDIELDILGETLEVWKERPGQPYTLVEIRDGKQLAGFCLYHKAQATEYTYDIHTLIVGRDYRGKGVGTRLVELVRDEIVTRERYAIIRSETSKTKEKAIEPGFYEANGFETIGHIPDFYENENDYYIYARAATRAAEAVDDAPDGDAATDGTGSGS